MPTKTTKLRLMTYNIGGGRKTNLHDGSSNLDQVIRVIQCIQPDILAVQEAVLQVDADGNSHSSAQSIAEDAGFAERYAFGPTLSRCAHMNVHKKLFVNSIFQDEQEWVQGNALFTRWEMVRLGNPAVGGTAANIPVFRLVLYEGNRDTDPRHALLARINLPPLYPFVIGTHFTTLVNERTERSLDALSESEHQLLQNRREAASRMRYDQARNILELLSEHVLKKDQMVILMGDFNALQSEACITDVLVEQGGFLHLDLKNPHISTHPKTTGAVDHILIYPRRRVIDYTCSVVVSPECEEDSDHRPVAAEVELDLS